ncbi:hypothetical protein TRVA0_078S00144 [Trichomonascus vanleenenianus]|uniref:Rgp1p n=1 Tax=Trichomonascus vanleenenianus TaxID=2268995 RepID=UPI003ECB4A99
MLRSNVRIEVSFENPVVFAGEQLSAIITFHNTSPASTVTRDRQGSLSTQEPSSPVIGANTGASLGRSASFRHAPAKSMSISRDESRTFFGSQRRVSLSSPLASRTESLLMGFAQLQGFFQLDDGIVDSSAFQHIRTQGIVVGQKGLGYGGSASGGFLRGLTHGIGSLLNKVDEEGGQGNGRSTSAEDSFPIFSTPQSLLFVDLKLAPGESKSYGYHIQIPKTLPPSSRGKAIRISYNLAIGTQRLDTRGRPVPRIILVPFRVFPFIDPFGEMPVHALSEPFVEKQDKALVSQLSDRKPSMKSLFAMVKTKKPAQQQQDALQNKSKQELLHGYISELIATAEKDKHSDTSSRLGDELFKGTLGAGSAVPTSRHPSNLVPESQDVRENIEYFIRYQYLEAEKPFKSTFEIGRTGMRIALVCLSKPIYRVGEDIVILLDFSNAALKCRHVTASLETSETIAEEYARWPPQDIRSMTRRVFVQLSSSSYSTSKTHFDLTIPSSATPQFSTSAISLSWYIQLTFVTSTTSSHSDLIEALMSDTHGMMVRAKSELDCVSVTCQIPITVFPTNQDIGTLLDYSSIVRKWTI